MRVFIAHAHADKPTARVIAEKLRAQGVGVFLDEDSLPAGDEYDRKIQSAIRGSDVFIFLISAASTKRGSYCLTELEVAKARWPNPIGHVLPVLLDNTDLSQVDPFLTAAVTVLRPRGNVATEVSAAIDRIASNRRKRRMVAIGAPILTLLAGVLGLASIGGGTSGSSATSSGGPLVTPDNVGSPARDNIAAINFAIGSYRACALRADGRVVCWGPAPPATELPPNFTAKPVLVQGIQGAESIAGDDTQFCVRAGRLTCWGLDMKTNEIDFHYDSPLVELAEKCLRFKDGRVMCWRGTPKDAKLVHIDHATALGHGAYPCIIHDDGEVACRDLGAVLDPQANRAPDDRFKPVPGLTGIQEIETSLFRSHCALSTGGLVKCWSGEFAQAATPTEVRDLSDIAHVAVSEAHACVSKRNGTVACWGSNASGQLGIATGTNSETGRPLQVPGVSDVVEIHAGGGVPNDGAGSTCVRKLNGEIWCWGVIVDSTTPVRIDLNVHG
jgi:hypothetical protein